MLKKKAALGAAGVGARRLPRRSHGAYERRKRGNHWISGGLSNTPAEALGARSCMVFIVGIITCFDVLQRVSSLAEVRLECVPPPALFRFRPAIMTARVSAGTDHQRHARHAWHVARMVMRAMVSLPCSRPDLSRLVCFCGV